MDFLIKKEGLDAADRIQLIISYALQLILVGAIVYLFSQQEWFNAVLTMGVLIFTFLPGLIRRNYHVFLPIEFDFIAILFVFMAIFLGEVHSYYTRYWWWDIVLHSTSGFLLGMAGFVLVYVLNEEKKLVQKMKPGFIALFGFAFALSLGTLWEIFEFSIDFIWGTHMQKSGLLDTMGDLMVDTLGAAVISILGYFFIRKGKLFIFDRMIHRFVEKNPQLFRKERNLS